MFNNYLKVALRTLLRERAFSIINILGLAVSVTAFWMIQHYVRFENGYESFMESKNDLYRVTLDVERNGQLVYQSSENYAGVGEALKTDIPEVVEYGRFYNMGSKNSVVIIREDLPEPITLKQKHFLYADASVLSLFSYKMLEGERDKALIEPFTMVISKTAAEQYFGSSDQALGKSLRLRDDDFNDELCKVTGVFEDSPSNTHLKFDVLISFSTIYGRDNGKGWAIPRYKTGWERKDYYTYVKLYPGTNPDVVEAKLPELVKKYKPDLESEGGRDMLSLQKIEAIHLAPPLTDEPEIHGSKQTVFYLSIVSWFILVIAWINYINLSTAKAINRAKEVGLRKVLGSHKKQLIIQFLTESLLVNFLSIALAYLLLILFLPLFSTFGGTPEDFQIWKQGWFWVSSLILFISGTILSGIYPAFVLSSFEPAATIKGKLRSSSHGKLLRRGLVLVQFATSIALIIGTGIVYEQMSMMQNRDLGFNTEQVVVIQRPAVQDTSFQQAQNDYNSFRAGVKSESSIKNFATSYVNPGKKLRFKMDIRMVNSDPSSGVPFGINLMDYDFIDFMGMDLVAGRAFSKEYAKDADTAIIINEAGARVLGFSDPREIVNQYVSIDGWGWKPQVVGVLKDFHQESLKEKVIPIMYGVRDFGNEFYLVKVQSDDISSTIKNVEKHWKASFGDNPMEYYFLDEYFDNQYQAEQQFRDLFIFFSFLTIFVGCLGLFGLSLFNTNQRLKEIGIRKTLGATETNIVRLFLSDAMKPVLIANLIAWPLTYYYMNGWLENYPYKINIDPITFLIATLMVLLVSIATIVSQTLKSARLNPVDVLKYE